MYAISVLYVNKLWGYGSMRYEEGIEVLPACPTKYRGRAICLFDAFVHKTRYLFECSELSEYQPFDKQKMSKLPREKKLNSHRLIRE